MTDKEIGDLWELARDAKPSLSDDLVTIAELIRKLVEERTSLLRTNHLDDSKTHHMLCEKCHMEYSEWIKLALRDFGIDPDTWK